MAVALAMALALALVRELLSKNLKTFKIVKVLRMGLSIVENLCGLSGNIFSPSRIPELHFNKKSNKLSNYIKFIDFPLFPLFGVPWAAVIFLTFLRG